MCFYFYTECEKEDKYNNKNKISWISSLNKYILAGFMFLEVRHIPTQLRTIDKFGELRIKIWLQSSDDVLHKHE